MLKALSEVAPTSVLISIFFWAGLSYFVTAPEISTRITRADYTPACEAGVASMAQTAAQQILQDSGADNARNDQVAQGIGQMNEMLNNSYV